MGNAEFWKRYIESYDRVFGSLDSYQALVRLHLEALSGKDKVLESCAGSGILGLELLRQGKEVHALDQNHHGLEILTERAREGNLFTYVGDAHNLDFDNDYFDGVSSMLGIPFMSDPIQYLIEHARVLRKNGVLVLSGPSESAKDFEFVGGKWIEQLKRKGKFDELRDAWDVVFSRTNENIRDNVHNWYSGDQLSKILQDEIGLDVTAVQPNPLYIGSGYVVTATKT